MASYTFTWAHPASEVFVTGTFDDWSKSAQLEKQGTLFSKTVSLASTDKILYKFVVDGNWTTDHTAPIEKDDAGNANNVLYTHDLTGSAAGAAVISGIAPNSSTVDKAGKVPLERSRDTVPGAFPDEGTAPIQFYPGDMVPDYSTYQSATQPQQRDPSDFSAPAGQSYGVAPLPATAGHGNPVSVKPGEPVPHSSTVTSSTLESNVKLDKESYENSGSGINLTAAGAAGAGAAAAGTASAFDLPPVSKSTIPESSLPMGAGTSAVEPDQGPVISSAAGTSTSTAALAGKVPLEPRGVPEVVSDSQHAAHADPEASASASAVQDKSAVEDELKSKVPEQGATTSTTEKQGWLAAAAASGVAVVGGTAAYAAQALGVPQSIQDKLPSTAAAVDKPSDDAPRPVQESYERSDASPEAAANPVAIAEKSAMEKELKKTVSATPETSASITDPSTIPSTEQAASTSNQGGVTGKAKEVAERAVGAVAPKTPTKSRAVDDRDVSPFTREPAVTSGVTEGKTATTSGAASSTPQKAATPAASAASPSTTASPSSKKDKRKSKVSSWFSDHFGSKSKK